MKKNIFLWVAVFAVGAMSSCSVDKVVDQAETNYIGFDPFANKVTRATTTAQGLGHKNFSVFGRYDNGTSGFVTVFENKEVKWSNEDNLNDSQANWEYTPLVPWVSGKNYQFAAIAPYKASGYSYTYGTDISTAGTYTLGAITVDASADKQIDYMTADVKTVSSGANPVSFVFNHILSKIDFNFQPQNEGEKAWPSDVKIDINSITLSSVVTTKSYTSGAWVANDATSSYESFSVSLSDNNSTTYEPSSTEADKVSELTGKFSWLVVPQSEADASVRKLAITFDVFTKDATGAYNVQVLTDESATIDIDTPWNPNTVYTYTVYIGSDILGQNPYITFDVASANWSTPNQESDLNVPTTTAP